MYLQLWQFEDKLLVKIGLFHIIRGATLINTKYVEELAESICACGEFENRPSRFFFVLSIRRILVSMKEFYRFEEFAC